MLCEAPAYRELDPASRQSLEHHMVKVAGYAAECLRDDWIQSERLGQQPVLVTPPVTAMSAADEFAPAAADQVARVTQATLQALSFPEFVADLINGSFNAIVSSSIRQMEAYTQLLEDVSKTVDQFMADNITDNQARDWLAQRYPGQIRVADGEPRLEATDDADELPAPSWRTDLALNRDVEPGDDDAYEEVLVPAARRKLAQSRLQMLSQLVLLGIHRIIVTGGKIRATMSYSVDTTDRAAQQRATDFDFRSSVAGSVGFGPWSASASVSIGYVNSTRNQSESQLDVGAELTGEVEIHFKSDVFELGRFKDAQGTAAIQANTPVPEQNIPWGSSIAAAPARTPRPAVEPIRPIGTMPAAPAPPVAPTPVTPVASPARPPTTTPSPPGATPATPTPAATPTPPPAATPPAATPPATTPPSAAAPAAPTTPPSGGSPNAVGGAVGEAIGGAVGGAVGGGTGAAVGEAVGGVVGGAIGGAVTDDVRPSSEGRER